MYETGIPRQLFYGELVYMAAATWVAQRKRYKDNLKTTASSEQTSSFGNLSVCAATNRTNWRALIRKATPSFEDDRRQRLATARDRRHRAASTPAGPDNRWSMPYLQLRQPLGCKATCVSADECTPHRLPRVPRDYSDIYIFFVCCCCKYRSLLSKCSP